MSWYTRIKALIKKELLAILNDKASRMTLLIPPIMQLFLFANAATLEVRHISIVTYNQDTGWYSQELIKRIQGSPYFSRVYVVDSFKDLQEIINTQKAIVGMHIQSDFSRKLAAQQEAHAQIILDGRKSNSSQIVQGYILSIIKTFNNDILSLHPSKRPQSINIISRNWFNQNLDYILYTVPHLVGILSMVIALLVTALSVAREREMGTFDQLLVSPLQTWEIVVGKMVPAIIIGVSESTVIMLLAKWMYHIPFFGSFLLFYFSLIIFVISIIGVGLFISSISQTQQQATLGVFVFIMPTMLLSGFATPIDNMPVWLQPVTWFIPITHLFVIIKGVFLKDMGLVEVLLNVWPMAFIGLFTLTLAGYIFSKKSG